jgi:aryl-alcohol dehydrogenase-like predicted oxidoreductase
METRKLGKMEVTELGAGCMSIKSTKNIQVMLKFFLQHYPKS